MVKSEVKKKSKKLAIQNGNETNKFPKESIRKYCAVKNTKKSNNCRNRRKNEYLRTKKNQKSINSTPNDKNKRKNSLLNVEKDITLYEIKPLSPTKLSISVKKFYNNSNLKPYQDNLHLHENNKLLIKEKTTINNHKDNEHLENDVKHDILNGKKKYRRIKKKHCLNKYRSYALVPQLNKVKHKNINTSVRVISRECNFQNNEIYKIKTNECLNDEYHVTQPINNSLSISVRRFYKSKIPSTINNNGKVNDDMPLISDNTFNSKTDFIQSPSSKLNNSHKISLNVTHINNTANDKQKTVTEFFPIRRSARKTKNIVIEEKQIALEKAIASLNENWLKIVVFPNKGRGVIADKDFTRGEYVVEYAGELIDIQEARKREFVYSQDITTGCYMYYFKHGSNHYCIDATAESSRVGRLVNHSRFGNLVPKVFEVSGLPKIIFLSKTNIKKGDELTYDYGDRSKVSLLNHPWLAF